MPKMKHPDSKQTIEVSPAQASLYASQGWQPVKASAAKKAAAKSAAEPTEQ